MPIHTKAADGLRSIGDPSAADAFRQAAKLAAKPPPLPNFMPVAYVHPPMQPMAETVHAHCEEALRQLRARAG